MALFGVVMYRSAGGAFLGGNSDGTVMFFRSKTTLGQYEAPNYALY